MRVQIRRPVPLTIHGHRRLFRRGDITSVAGEIGERLVARGWANPVADDATSLEGERVTPVFDDMTVDDLQALADERGVTVEGTGAGGKVLKGDLVNALTVA